MKSRTRAFIIAICTTTATAWAPFTPSQPSSAPDWRTGEALLDIKADFGSMVDSHGDLIYTPNAAGAFEAGRLDEWLSRQRAAGLTHVVVGDFHAGGYPGFPLPNPEYSRDPKKIRTFLEHILNTPSADGKGFTPIVMFDAGTHAYAPPKKRVDQDWPIIKQAMTEGGRDLREHIVPVPGYELIKASEWSSNDLYYGLRWLRANGFKNICVHNSPGRVGISSKPVEADDPARGQEIESFTHHGGEYVDCLLFQVDPPRPTVNLNCDYVRDNGCFLLPFNRAVVHAGLGHGGWRRLKKIVFFESVVYGTFRRWPGVTNDFARDVAAAAKRVCDRPAFLDERTKEVVMLPPVSCAWGNGLPRS